MRTGTRMQRIFRKTDQMDQRGVICSEEREITSDLAREGQERDVSNLATFIQNAKVENSNSRKELEEEHDPTQTTK